MFPIASCCIARRCCCITTTLRNPRPHMRGANLIRGPGLVRGAFQARTWRLCMIQNWETPVPSNSPVRSVVLFWSHTDTTFVHAITIASCGEVLPSHQPRLYSVVHASRDWVLITLLPADSQHPMLGMNFCQAHSANRAEH
jgi:hypothetical protein